MIPKRSFILPAVSALAVGGVLWAAHGSVPLASAKHHAAKHLNAKLAADTISFGGCTATAGTKNLLSKPVPASGTATQYKITFNDGSGLACGAWVVNGTTVAAIPPGPGKNQVLTSPTVSATDTVMAYVVDGEHGGKWDTYTWGPNTNSKTAPKTMTFSPTCTGSNGQENLLFNPSGYGANVSITYSDEWEPTCWVWFVNGQFVEQDNGSPAMTPSTGNHRLSFQLPPNLANDNTNSISIGIVDGDHGGDWDIYTWTKPGCGYPPGSVLTASVNNKGEISGHLAVDGNCDGKKHQVTATYSDGGKKSTATTNTDKNQNFKFGGKPANQFPATVSFAGDADAPGAPDITCPGYNQPCS